MKKTLKILMFFLAFVVVLGAAGINVGAKEDGRDIVIVIDAGHGGSDPGTQAVTGAYEKDCNLAIALAMKEELETYGKVKVYLTRSEDEWLTNTGRAMAAAALKADFLISIHNNSGSATNTGALAYRSVNSYYSEATNDMCNLILENLAATGLHNGGVQTRVSTQYDYEDYYTIIAEGVRAGVPTVIVEHCFLSNPKDAAVITNENGTINSDAATTMGKADATAVASYFSLVKRTATADNETTVTLEKSYSVTLNAPGSTGKTVNWYSVDDSVAKVSKDGVVTAVGTGTTNVVYKFSDGTTGSCTIEVPAAKPVALVGAVDPTFYSSAAELEKIDLKSVFGFVMYSDGSSVKVKPDYVGSVDYEAAGIQDIIVKYGELSGFVRIVQNSSQYIPEVTLPAETDPSEDETPSETQPGTQNESKGEDKEESDKDNLIKLLKFVIIFLVVLIIGIVIFMIESSVRRKRGHRRRRGRRRY